MARRTDQAERLDRLTDVFSTVDTSGPTLGDVLNGVTDLEARAMLAGCAETLLSDGPTDPGTTSQADAAAWLWRGLWKHPERDPSMSDLRALVSPFLPWPE